MKYVTIGSTFSGNKGAASMLEASIQTITDRDNDAEFTTLTVYPEQDKPMNGYGNVRVLGLKPLFLGAVINPLAIFYKLLPPLRRLLRRQKHIRVIAEADVFLDQGGITFVDGRTKFLIYNVATILPPLLLGTRVVKCSQAMGPFSGLNKMAARIILPRIDTICARGAVTHEYLKGLNLKNVIESTDYAFLMEITKNESQSAKAILENSGFAIGKKGKRVIVMPSEVVRKKTEATGQDYVAYNAEFITYLLEKGYHVMLLAYSARGGRDSRHNNDLPVCRDIASRIQHDQFVFLDQEFSAQQARYIIGQMDFVVASRFHAMIAALSMGVPPLIIGWSHKYAEIMDMFGLDGLALDSGILDQKSLRETFNKLTKNWSETRRLIDENLPTVKNSAKRQVDEILTYK